MPKAGNTRKAGGKRSGKKAKNQWRTGDGNVIAKQVEEKRAADAKQQRQLGGAADKLPADKLFFIDKAQNGSSAAISKKIAKRTARLRSQAILVPNANIAAIGTPRPALPLKDQAARKLKKPTVSSKETKKLLARMQGKQGAACWSKTQKARPRRGAPAAPRQRQTTDAPESFDLWSAPGAALAALASKTTDPQENARENQPNRAQKQRYSALRPVAARVNPAVDVSEPGMSYNPDREQHQDLIGEALGEVYTKRAEAKLLKNVDVARMGLQYSMLPGSKLVDPTDMLDDEADEQLTVEDSAAVSKAQISGSKAAKRERLTQAQRNKRERVKLEGRRLVAAKKEKAMKVQLAVLGQTLKEVDGQLAAQVVTVKRKAAKRAAAQTRPLRMGKHRLKPGLLAAEVPLTEELDGSLRTVRQKGSLLADRLRSLQRRNVVEPTVPDARLPRRYRLGTYTTEAGRLDPDDL